MLVVLTFREEESGVIEAAAFTVKGLAEAPVIKCLEAWNLKKLVFVGDGEPAIQAWMTAVKLSRQEETVVTGKRRYDSKSNGLVEHANQLVRVVPRTWLASIEKRYQTTLSPSSPLLPWCVRHCGWSLIRYTILEDGLDTIQKTGRT